VSVAVSSSAAVSWPGCGAVAVCYPPQRIIGECPVDLASRHCKPPSPDLPQLQQLVEVDVAAPNLGKIVEEYRPVPCTV
jgi:hypothetical protein